MSPSTLKDRPLGAVPTFTVIIAGVGVGVAVRVGVGVSVGGGLPQGVP